MWLKKEVPNANDDNPVCMRKGDSVEEKTIIYIGISKVASPKGTRNPWK